MEILSRQPTSYSSGFRLGNYLEIRELLSEKLERAFAGVLSAQEALKQGATEGNALLESFEKEMSPESI